MCTLMSTADMPTNSSKQQKINSFISWFPKPNKDGENMRVRLLWYLQGSKNDRKTPYFTQMVHDHWGENLNHQKIVDETIVCPSTKYSRYDEEKWVLNEKTGKKMLNCPLCQKANEAMSVWKNSGWKDKLAMKRYFALQPKFRAIIPVYVINDPNNQKNNGKMKAMILTNREDYELFDKVVKAEKARAIVSSKNGHPYEIFNGKGAVDLYLHCETVEETKKNGFVQKVRKMTGIAFDSPESKYDIPDICKDKLDMFDMDDQFYVSNSKTELEDFYKRNYLKDEVIIPKENVDIFKNKKQDVEVSKPVSTVVHNEINNDDTVSIPPMEDIPEDEPDENVIESNDSSDETPSDIDQIENISQFLSEIDNI